MLQDAHRSGPTTLSASQVAALDGPSVVTVTATVFRGKTRALSGFFYGKRGHVITSGRALSRATDVKITDVLGTTFPAFPEGIDTTLDIAELETTDFAGKALVATASVPTVGLHTVVIGNSLVGAGQVAGTDQKLTVGTKTYGSLIQTDAPADASADGGPLLDSNGKLLGAVSTEGTGYAYAVPVGMFDAEVKSWQASGSLLHLGPPLVTELPQNLVVSSVGSDFSVSESKAWGSSGWNKVFHRDPNYTYGGVVIDFYLLVRGTESSAHRDYSFYLSEAKGRGYASAGGVNGLGDEATALQRSSSDQVYNEVIWRDRNAVALVYLNSGIPPAPDVTLSRAIELARQQEAPLAESLASYQ